MRRGRSGGPTGVGQPGLGGLVVIRPLRQRRAGLLRTHFLYRSGRVGELVEAGLKVLPLLRADGPATELIDLLR